MFRLKIDAVGSISPDLLPEIGAFVFTRCGLQLFTRQSRNEKL
jgi:hypothetical protein